jgi:tetratricopeptide (TPR) repeat protein
MRGGAGIRATVLALLLVLPSSALAGMDAVRGAYDSGQYFSAARMAFNDLSKLKNPPDRAKAYFWIAQSLVKAGLDQSAIYFFANALQIRDRDSTRLTLELAPLLLDRGGSDLIRKILLKHTRSEDYSPRARSAYWYSLSKESLLKGDYASAVSSAGQVSSTHPLYPVSLQIRGTALLLQGKPQAALSDFRECERSAEQRNRFESGSVEAEIELENPGVLLARWKQLRKEAARDLESRCIADQARVLYELKRFEEADRLYDRIPKSSFVWTDTLFEHAWNTFAREEYNRTLGKLVSYKSPSLSFSLNSEIDILMAQSYMSLCLYDDAGRIIDDFGRKIGTLARDVKNFVEQNPTDALPYYELGRSALRDKLHTPKMMNRFLNRFVRSPVFQGLALSEDRVLAEKAAIERLDNLRSETRTGIASGFPGFLNLMLDWRVRTIRMLGGVYVRNSMIDYHQVLISDLEKMQFMKIDILSHQKQKLLDPEAAQLQERSRGNRIPVRRDDQLLWSFNGEFWNDEIGDYVFALESECAKGKASNGR